MFYRLWEKKNLKKPQEVEKFIQTFLNKHFI